MKYGYFFESSSVYADKNLYPQNRRKYPAVVSRMEHYHADDNLDEMKRFTVRNKGA